jgi:hypothetical protein
MNSFLAPAYSIYVNSQYASSGTSSDFRADIPGALVPPESGRTTRVAVTSATIPLTYYGVTSANNILNVNDVEGVTSSNNTLQVADDYPVTSSNNTLGVGEFNGSGTTFTVTIPTGFYTQNSFISALNTALTTASAASGFSFTYTCSISGNIIELSTNQGSPNYSIFELGAPSTCLALLGITAGSGGTPHFNNSAIVFGSSSVPFKNPYNVTLPVGGYTSAQFVAALNTAMTAASVSSGLGLVFTSRINTSTSVITFSTSTSGYQATLTLGSPTTMTTLLGVPNTGSATFSSSSTYSSGSPSAISKAYNATIPPGSYTIDSFETALNGAMTAASAASGYSNTFTSTIDTDTGSIVFSLTPGTSNAGAILTFGAPTTADGILGLPLSGFSPFFNATTDYDAPGVVNIAGPREILIRSPSFITNCYESRTTNDSTILAIMQIQGEPFQDLVYSPAVPKIFATLGAVIRHIDIQITDENGNVLNLNGAPVLIQLAFYYC